MRAVLLESMGKQQYIFATNKVREMVGASELVAASTTDWVCDAVGGLAGVTVTTEVLVSGRALLSLAGPDAEQVAAAEELVWQVTRRALREAPGLQVLGTSMPLPEGSTAGQLMPQLAAQLEVVRMRAVPVEARVPRLPVVASCASSGRPAQAVVEQLPAGETPVALSAECMAKRRSTEAGRRRMGRYARHELVDSGELERRLTGEVRWLGVVHADGNNMGAMFQQLHGAAYAEVSGEIDRCTTDALAAAARWLRDSLARENQAYEKLPLVPLIAGGDDLTALVDGWYALPFAVAYLREFERLTAASQILADRTGRPYLTASAGVAVVKPHFPVATAYRLCEEVCASAKSLARESGQDGRSVSTVDWHVHHDSTGDDLGRIRKWARRDDGRWLLRRPYAVTDLGASAPQQLRHRQWARLEWLAESVPVRAHPELGSALPASQLVRLRRMLTSGDLDGAERLYGMLCKRPELALLRLLSDGEATPSDATTRLFASEREAEPVPRAGADNRTHSTVLVDFLDAVEFLPGSRVVSVEEEATAR